MKRLAVVSLLIAFALAAGCGDEKVTKPEPTPPSALRAEAETMTDSHDVGFTSIYVASRAAASGGKAVEGLDRMLEWIEIPMTFAQSGAYTVRLHHASKDGVQVTVTVLGGAKDGDPEWVLSLNAGGCS
jgi:hypothetical protein